MNLVDGELLGETFAMPTGFTLTVGHVDATGQVTLGLRPDDLLLTATGDSNDGLAQVKLIELLGPRAIVTVDARGTEFTCVVDTSRLTGISEGVRVALSARPGAVHVFDPQTGQRLVGASAQTQDR
jgi:multiple sugar transport system ATP-binding protein